jgi:hypothetical protein
LPDRNASAQNFGHSHAFKNRNAGAAMSNEPTIRLSTAIIEHLTKIYEKGGLALAVLLIGSLTMVFAFWLSNNGSIITSYALIAAGFCCILFVIIKLYIEIIVKIKTEIQSAQIHAETIDAIQDVALSVSNIYYIFTNYILLNAHICGSLFDITKNVIATLPAGKYVTESNVFSSGETFIRSLVDFSNKNHDLGVGLRDAIKNADAKSIKEHMSGLAELQKAANELISKRIG